ncbi:septal ring lytic transglycosylase RlpA family protein [Alteromonas sp. ASW11-130]|uniref:septal ring lytic transglycosylase RlpA family protein n=1 Tax=Alteromonas sp. ASW11-130 TaxID=3015775 RepID=UPI0022425A15|nr:septal ring lytic transglycosylase RlpA family protein [Alteromonas sp. ASW11-130]MCW8092097.1 septal ring lytic transglycosylase RlpA family protein [Alteromonas sp. ASW11-130]
MRYVVVLLLLITIVGCQTPSQGRYKQRYDSAPRFQHKEISIVDAVPKYEPYRSYNSRPYEVLGQRYFPLQTGKGFEEEGYASWYGQKFHGHLTSNGETYNMFAMTAAHKTLPLPSYVRVTNLENNKQVIVRVNDRGPFHPDRIIDLSYAASHKLGYQSKGTAKVRLEVIHFDEENNVTIGSQPTMTYAEYAVIDVPVRKAEEQTKVTFTPGLYIQVAALSDIEKARSVSTVLSSLYQVPAEIPLVNNIYKLRLGPLSDRFQAKMLLAELKKNGYPGAYTVEMNL